MTATGTGNPVSVDDEDTYSLIELTFEMAVCLDNTLDIGLILLSSGFNFCS